MYSLKAKKPRKPPIFKKTRFPRKSIKNEKAPHKPTLSSISNLYKGGMPAGGAVVLCAKKCKSKRNDAKDLLGCHESKDFMRQE